AARREQPLGQPGQLERVEVPGREGLPRREERAQEGRGRRYRHGGQRAEPLVVPRREPPRDRGAPVVPDDVHARGPADQPVHRGEPAMRLIHAAREWNAERSSRSRADGTELADRDGGAPLRTIALYTAVDRHAMFVREADEAVLIGPEDPDQAFATSPYLDY